MEQVHAEVGAGALADAGLTFADVDGYYCDGDVDALQIGDRVEVTLYDTGQGAARPRFRPAGR